MRRVLFIILLVVLPIQFSWATATAYCAHESGEAAKHFGHHEHQHRVGTDAGAKDNKGKKVASPTLADSDCSTCQLSAAQPIPPAGTDTPVPGTESPRFAHSARYRSFIPSGPERPDRSAPTPAVRFGGAVMIGALLLD